ncbi:MAG: ABC transporter permease [Muribaculaceae bacterium]|nr:ABC transporter permease [Muribaculaceae bacterium]
MFDLFREISQTLRNNRLRTFLTGIAVAWGIFMLIVLLGMARGVVNSFENMNWSKTSNRISIYQGTTSKPYKGYSSGRAIKPEMEDLDILKERNPDHVEKVTTYAFLGNIVFSTSKDYMSVNPQGVYPEEGKIDNLNIIYGRFINEADLNYKRKTVVIDEKNAALLFGDAAKAVGQRIDGNGLSWLVVGVYRHDWRSDIYMPFSTAKMLSGNDKYTSNMSVTIQNVETMEDGENAEKEIRTTLARQHEFAPDDESGLYFSNQFTSYLRNKAAFNILNLSVWIIGIFTLLSGIVGVSNIMFVSVKERTHEIGIRRAIGAKPRSILLQIVAESVVITTLFGYIGVVLGMVVTQFIAAVTAGSDFLENPTVSLQIALEVTIVLIIAGALAGLAPALKATKVKPVEALRDE